MNRRDERATARRALEEAAQEARAALAPLLAPAPAGTRPVAAQDLRADAERLRRTADLVGRWADAADALADVLDGDDAR